MPNIRGMEYSKVRYGTFRLDKNYLYKLRKFPEHLINNTHIYCRYYKLENGRLDIYKGFQFGATGAIDDKTILRGACVHDVLCYMIEEGYLNPSARVYADREMKLICKEDGMFKARREWVYFGIRYVNKALHKLGIYKAIGKIGSLF